MCPVGHYCEEGSEPTPCPLLYYRDQLGGKHRNDCFPCPAGYWCNVTGMVSYNASYCPIGHFCLSASEPEICPPGRLRMNQMDGRGPARNPDECDPCPEGFACPVPRNISCNETSLDGVPCERGYYCPSNVTDGTAIPLLCPKGYYCHAQTGNNLTLCEGEFFNQYTHFWTHRPLGGWSYRFAAVRSSVRSSVRLLPAFLGN